MTVTEQEKSRLQKLAGINLIEESYELMFESIDPSNHYDFEHTRKNVWEFKDRIDIQYFIIINQSLYKGETKAEIKFGWVDDKGVKRYDKPPKYDERIYNTFVYIFLNEILKYYSEYFTEFYLEAIDPLRHRLYRQTMNNFLDFNKFSLEELPDKNILIIKVI